MLIMGANVLFYFSGSSWHLVLTTLQHLVWILGLKPSTGGSLKAARETSQPNAGITTSVMADLPVLSTMLSRLFESSQYLDDVALHHLINALCKLSHEAMELAYSNREPSLFAVAKLLETGNFFNPPVLSVDSTEWMFFGKLCLGKFSKSYIERE